MAMDKNQFLPYGSQSIDKSDIEAVSAVLKGDWITRGPKVREFEEAIASYCDAKYGVAFTNCSHGLWAAYKAAGVSEGDRFLTTPNSFVSTTSGALQMGGQPIFIDIEEETGNLSLEQLSCNLNVSLTRGKEVIVPVHFGGVPVDMERVDGMIRSPETVVIEDAAHAFGSCYEDGSRVGSCSYSSMTVFSFHPVKNITTGEGGVVTTNSEELYEKLKCLRDSGRQGIDVVELSSNYHMTEFQAALGLSQLKRVDKFRKKREQLVSLYCEKLAEHPLVTPMTQPSPNVFHNLFVVKVEGEDRGELMADLKEKGIGTQVHYRPIYHHSLIKNVRGDLSSYFPAMESYYEKALSLPLFVGMEEEDVERVVLAIG